MARVKLDSDWFSEIIPSSFYDEEDLERSLKLNLENLFPDFKVIDFKMDLVNSNTGKTNRADLAIVKNDYSEWYIVEVELSTDDLGEVVKQVDTFLNYKATSAIGTFLHRKKKKLDKDQLIKLGNTIPAKVMVIVNEYNCVWQDKLKNYNCDVFVFQIYLNGKGIPLYRLHGKHPHVYTDFCYCKLQKNLPYTIEVLDNSFCDTHNIMDGNQIMVEYGGKLSKWERTKDVKADYLICTADIFPLDPSTKRYQLSYEEKEKIYHFSKA